VACTAGDRIDTAISDQPVPGGRQWRGDQWCGDPSTKRATITATAKATMWLIYRVRPRGVGVPPYAGVR
jgi:hypothetical protein